jgi:hypothetical protein
MCSCPKAPPLCNRNRRRTEAPARARPNLSRAAAFAPEEHRKQLADRYGPRLRQTLHRVAQAGQRILPTIRGSRQTGPHATTRLKSGKRSGGSTGRGGAPVLGRPASNGTDPGTPTKHVETDLPPVTIVAGEQDDAVWLVDSEIFLAKDHNVIRTQLGLWQEQWPSGTEGIVEDAVLRWYSDSLSLRVAHVDSLKSIYTEEQRNEMKSPAALTSSLLGLIADDYVLNPVLGSKLGAKRR